LPQTATFPQNLPSCKGTLDSITNKNFPLKLNKALKELLCLETISKKYLYQQTQQNKILNLIHPGIHSYRLLKYETQWQGDCYTKIYPSKVYRLKVSTNIRLENYCKNPDMH
jgi:hypothetical protein